MTENSELMLRVVDKQGKEQVYQLGTPINASRMVSFLSETTSTNAFYLARPEIKTVEIENVFVGDVDRGGSCNVDYLTYIPHNVTHIETAAHILSDKSNPPYISDIPADELSGLVYLVDLSDLAAKPGALIELSDIESKLSAISLPVGMVAIKTLASSLSDDFDFSGKDYMALSAEAAKFIHDLNSISQITGLLHDLPSTDPEADEGKLLAHRSFFGLPNQGILAQDVQPRFIVELASFKDFAEGYYYAQITPPKFQVNAIAAGITLRRLEAINGHSFYSKFFKIQH